MKNFIQQDNNSHSSYLSLTCNRDITFGDFFLQFMNWKEKETALSTARNYMVLYNHFVPRLGNRLLNTITGACLDKIFDEMKLAPASRRTYRRILSAVFNDAIRLEFLDRNPCNEMRKIRQSHNKINLQLPTEEQLRGYIKRAKADGNILVYKLLLLATATGMRLGEILNLKRSDIDLKEKIINVRAQLTNEGADRPLKTDSSYRKIYVAREILQDILCNTHGIYLFTPNSFPDRQISRRTADKYIHCFFKTVETPYGFTFHSLRHYHATQLLCRGISLKEVSKRLGHASVNITADIYTHWLEEMDKKAAEVLGKELLV